MLTRFIGCALFLCFGIPGCLAGEWEDYLSETTARVSHPRHLPYRLDHGHKTARSVLLVHGIFSSPLYFRGMAEAFHAAGHNVVTVLLPGHFERDQRAMGRTRSEDWSAEVDRGYALARERGEKVILAGHSLGALLGVEQALKRPAGEVAGLVLVSPALRLMDAVLAACRAGRAVGLSGNVFINARPDNVQIPYFDPYAGVLIHDTYQRVLTGAPDVPVYMAYTWNDNVLDVFALERFYQALPGPKQRRTYPWGGVTHGSISQSPRDEATHGNGHNRDFDRMMREAVEFIARN